MINRSRLTQVLLLTAMLFSASARQTAAQTLLETFVFMQSAGIVDVDNLKETADGKLPAPRHPSIVSGGESTWSVLDRSNCVLRDDTPSLGLSVTYYLNNVNPDYTTGHARQNVQRLTLYGDKPIVCSTERGESKCSKELSLEAINGSSFVRLQKALAYIYENFCTLAKPAKPF